MTTTTETQRSTLSRFLNEYFPEEKFVIQESRSNSMTTWYTYNGDRSKYLKLVEEDAYRSFNGLSVKYFPVSPGSSVGRLIVTADGNRVRTIYLKPHVSISNNFNAMLTELLPLAWLRSNSGDLLNTDGFLQESVVDSITHILKRQGKDRDKIDNLICQLEEKSEYVRGKRREIELIIDFYRSHADSWSIREALESGEMYKWLGYDRSVKNYGYVDRADVQIGPNCRISLKSVVPTEMSHKIFLCNTTFKSLMNDMQRFTGSEIIPCGEDIVLKSAEMLEANTYGELLFKYFKFLFNDSRLGLRCTYHVLHYILGDYRSDIRRNESGYNHILLTSSNGVRELGVDDAFIFEAMNSRPRCAADVEYINGKMVITFGDPEHRQMLDVQFNDSEIRRSDPAKSLKFKILENPKYR